MSGNRVNKQKSDITQILGKQNEPLADIARCSACEWNGPYVNCEEDKDGDWETGYYKIHLCPKCGECIDDYSMSDDQYKKWQEWAKPKGITW